MMTNNLSYYLNIARIYAKQGNCLKRNYGCVIVNPEGNIVSAGNTHSVDKCFICKRRFSRKGHGYDKCPSIHAEQEAVVGIRIPHGSVAFLACYDMMTGCEIKNPAPCPTCSKLLRYAGIKEVITATEVIEL